MYDASVNGHGATTPREAGAGSVGWELGAEATAPGRPRETMWRLLRRATVVGAGISLVLHLVLWAVASLWTVRYENADAGGSQGSVVDFAVMSEVELSSLQSAELELDSPSVPDVSGAEAAPVELMAAVTGAESITPDLARVELNLGGGDASASSFDLSAPGSGATGAGSGASFFGLEAQGRRFAYIVDRSGSMAYGRNDGPTRMRLTQDELSRSVDALLESAEFFIVMYSDGPDIIGNRRMWTDATTRKKLWARSQIERVIADGGTRPLGAFETVFRLRPQPDAIYFMTDGRFPEYVAESVKEMNGRARVPVHCIMFGEFDGDDADDVERIMRLIARESGGSFARVEGRRP